MLARIFKVADLIINVNLDESRKKQRLLVEVYEGTILVLKSKQFSGPLRSINLSSIPNSANLSSEELQNIKNIFNSPMNIQINKNQYLFSLKYLPYLKTLVGYGCVFCKDRRQGPMYKLEQLLINSRNDKLEYIYGFFVLQEKTILYVNYEIGDVENVYNDITPLFYVNIDVEDYQAQLFFDYGRDLIKADDKERLLHGELKYRDYGFEENIIARLRVCHWKKSVHGYFVYFGQDITTDMSKLDADGIQVFTNQRKRISIANFKNIHVSYGVDWFEIGGMVAVGDDEIPIGELINFRKGKETWVEYNGQIVFFPLALKRIRKSVIEKKDKSIRVSKKDIFSALEVINFLGGKGIEASSQLYTYQNIQLHLSKPLEMTLRNYQKDGVKWLLSLRKNGFGGCLADDMGLGKTIQVIAYFSDKSQVGTKALIVVPKTIIENWNREFKKFAPEITTYVYHGNSRNLTDALDCRVIITTYGTVLNDIGKLSKCKFNHLIIDEAQNIKNSRSKAYRAINAICAETRIVMTGTPLENNIQEYWGLMNIANPTVLKYKALTKGLTENQIVEKVKRLTSPFLLRRLKKNVLDDLPEKEEQTIFCSLDEGQRELYKKMLESIKHEFERKADRYEIKSNSIVLNGLLYLQEICCHPKLLPKEYNVEGCNESAKLEQLLLMLDELYSSGHKVVVFSRFTQMLKIIRKELAKRHFNQFYLDGTVRERQGTVDDFEHSTEGIFLISLKAGGIGLNLVSADTVIMYDPWWNPAVEKQAEDRIYRIGQTNKVTVFKLIATNTIEEKVQLLQETKKRLIDDVVEGHDTPQNITMEDIRNLLF